MHSMTSRRPQRPRTLGYLGSPILDISALRTPAQPIFQRLFSNTVRTQSTNEEFKQPDQSLNESSITSEEENVSRSMLDEHNSVTNHNSTTTAVENDPTQQHTDVKDLSSQTHQIVSEIEEELNSLRNQVQILLSQQIGSTTVMNDQSRKSTMPAKLPHLTDQSAVHMVSVTDKISTKRKAIAIGSISLSHETLKAIASHAIKKGDVLGVARIAAIQGVKKTSDLIPLCHPGLSIEGIKVDINIVSPDPSIKSNERNALPTWLSKWLQSSTGRLQTGIKLAVTVESTGKTGIEMEALAGATAGLLTVYDMCKSLSKEMIIESRVAFKSGGKSGTWSHSMSRYY